MAECSSQDTVPAKQPVLAKYPNPQCIYCHRTAILTAGSVLGRRQDSKVHAIGYTARLELTTQAVSQLP